MRIYRGPKGCPGCKISGTEKPRHAVDEICHDCMSLIKKGKELDVIRAQATDRYIRITLSRYTPNTLYFRKCDEKGSLIYNGPKSEYKRVINPEYMADTPQKEGSSRTIIETFTLLFRALDEGQKGLTAAHMDMEESHHTDGVYFVKESVALAFMEFYEAFGKYSTRLRKHYLEEGTKMLINLNAGHITLDQFNEKIK